VSSILKVEKGGRRHFAIVTDALILYIKTHTSAHPADMNLPMLHVLFNDIDLAICCLSSLNMAVGYQKIFKHILDGLHSHTLCSWEFLVAIAIKYNINC
jgi:hypothetical protein